MRASMTANASGAGSLGGPTASTRPARSAAPWPGAGWRLLSTRTRCSPRPWPASSRAWLRAIDPALLQVRGPAAARGLAPSLADLADLDRLQQDELAWEARVLQFRDYHRLWQRQGVLPLVRRLMSDFEVPGRCWPPGRRAKERASHGSPASRRTAPARQPGTGRRTRADPFLARPSPTPTTRARPQAAPGERRRPGAGDHHPQVQGLEYPLVFLPFIGNHRPPNPTTRRCAGTTPGNCA
ncbi:hypothetical protein DSL92_06760 [Billgrantia gudaonensis]|uniref:Uncharacterized protein n=1 Tax=Billgrantia gudaonensis TaxID=376427 RepID=A0A3S0QFR2_9GAMM|nr:hypothetical protein DSL92_06760 [Halomonas gudaonensis]